MAKVLVTIPNQHWLHSKLVHSLIGGVLSDSRYQVCYADPSTQPIENNRNWIAKMFRETDKDYDYLLTIDSDNPPLCNPLDLVDLDLDIIGCPTPLWKLVGSDHPVRWNTYTYMGEDRQEEARAKIREYANGRSSDPLVDLQLATMIYTSDHNVGSYHQHINRVGLQEVDAVGAGCMLVAARVLKHPSMVVDPFSAKRTSEGISIRGEDLAFCERAKELGFKVWTHYDYPCDHYKELSLLDVCRRFDELYNTIDEQKAELELLRDPVSLEVCT